MVVGRVCHTWKSHTLVVEQVVAEVTACRWRTTSLATILAGPAVVPAVVTLL